MAGTTRRMKVALKVRSCQSGEEAEIEKCHASPQALVNASMLTKWRPCLESYPRTKNQWKLSRRADELTGFLQERRRSQVLQGCRGEADGAWECLPSASSSPWLLGRFCWSAVVSLLSAAPGRGGGASPDFLPSSPPAPSPLLHHTSLTTTESVLVSWIRSLALTW